MFGWFAAMTSVAGLVTWFGISVTYIRFYAGLKAQGIDRAKLPFKSSLQPYAAWYAAGMITIICIVSVRVYFPTDTVLTHPSFFFRQVAGKCSCVEIGPSMFSSPTTFLSCFSPYCTLEQESTTDKGLSRLRTWISSPI